MAEDQLKTAPRDHMLGDGALDQLFRTARTYYSWEDRDVPETTIRALYDLLKMGPTSANQSPARFLFLHSHKARERLRPHLIEGNVEKTLTAPWTVIVAWDTEFYEKIPELFPHNPDARDWFSSPDAAFDNGFRNGTLQGAYLIMAARALGLDCGPMSGFDKAGVDKEFFESDPGKKTWKSNFLVNLGHGTDEQLHPRLPRLDFEDAAEIL